MTLMVHLSRIPRHVETKQAPCARPATERNQKTPEHVEQQKGNRHFVNAQITYLIFFRPQDRGAGVASGIPIRVLPLVHQSTIFNGVLLSRQISIALFFTWYMFRNTIPSGENTKTPFNNGSTGVCRTLSNSSHGIDLSKRGWTLRNLCGKHV